VAQRRCPLRLQGRGVGGRRHVANCRVGSHGVEILHPSGDDGAGVVHREEQMLVETFVAHPPLEALGEGVLGWLARRDIAPVEPGRLGEGHDRRRRELGAVVADDRPRPAARRDQQAKLVDMLRRPEGASIEEIAATFSWQKHTVRGAISGALKKKLGLAVVSEKIDGRGTVYKLPA
jgi:hypothetical protein